MPRRLAITGPHRIEVIEYEDPRLQPKQVLIKTEIASGKHGTTMAMMDSINWKGQRFDEQMRLFVPTGEQEKQPTARWAHPHGTGTTGVGTIIEIGSEVARWKPGDRVFGLMDIRETNICHEDSLYELGDLDPKLALCIEPAYVSFHAVRESNVRFGDTVAVVGLGALGLLAVRIALASGAEQIYAVDPIEKRRKWALDNGADYALDPTQVDAALEIHRLNGGPGVDVAIELSGSYAALQTAIRCARICGTVCSSGFYQGESRGLWLGREWHHNRLTVIVPHGCGWGHPPRDYPRWDQRRAYDAIVSMMRQGKLTAPGLIDPVVKIEDGPAVFDMIEHDPSKVIKYAVEFD